MSRNTFLLVFFILFASMFFVIVVVGMAFGDLVTVASALAALIALSAYVFNKNGNSNKVS